MHNKVSVVFDVLLIYAFSFVECKVPSQKVQYLCFTTETQVWSTCTQKILPLPGMKPALYRNKSQERKLERLAQ
jgi:hypothetical protein